MNDKNLASNNNNGDDMAGAPSVPLTQRPIMLSRGEGTIGIHTNDFEEFINERIPIDQDLVDDVNIHFGPPKPDADGNIQINFSWGSEDEPEQWSEKPQSVKDWDELADESKGPTKAQLMNAGSKVAELWNDAQSGKGGGTADKLKAAVKVLETLTRRPS